MATPTPAIIAVCRSPAAAAFRQTYRAQPREMLPGRQAVAEAIVSGGLEHYYNHRSESAANPQPAPGPA